MGSKQMNNTQLKKKKTDTKLLPIEKRLMDVKGKRVGAR